MAESFVWDKLGVEDVNVGYGTFGPVTLPDGSSATLNKVGLHTWNRVFNVMDFGAVGSGGK
jgi:hypothetical protein